MKKLQIEDSLLLVDMEITFNNRSIHLHRVLVDTGSGSTVISTDLAESIGIVAEEDDMIYLISGVGGSEFVYSKRVDAVKIGDMQTTDFGLDLLQQLKAIINIDKLILHSHI